MTRASLERIDGEQHQRALDVTLDAAGKNTPLQDGDIVRVLPISPSFDQTVTVRGNVADPGRFAWHPGMKLSELLPNSQSLVTRDYWQKRNQLGLPSPVFQPDYAQRFTAYRQTQAESQRQYLLYLQQGPGETALRCSSRRAERAEGISRGRTAAASSATTAPPGIRTRRRQSNNMPSAEWQPTSEVTLAGRADTRGRCQTSRRRVRRTRSRATTRSVADRWRIEQRMARTENTSMARYLNDVSLMAPEIDWSYAVIERMDPVTLKTTLIPFDLGKLVREHDASQDLAVSRTTSSRSSRRRISGCRRASRPS